MLNLKKLLTKFLDNEDKKHSISSIVSITSGTLSSIGLTVFYTKSDIKSITGRVLVSGLSSNVRPTITVNVPADMPTVSYIGATIIRGTAGSPTATDPPVFNHTYGSTTATITMANNIGSAPAGWASMTF